jgi:glycerol uptake facilitator protein
MGEIMPPEISPYLAEFIGTMLLILFGNGVVANVVLSKTKGHASGWIVITTGWAMAVTIGVYASFWVSGGHINPAVTISLAALGRFPWSMVPGYIVSQFLGAFVGAILVYLAYMDHFRETTDKAAKLSVFSTIPQIRSIPKNFLTEVIATFALVLGVMAITAPESGVPQGLIPVVVGFLVWGIGLCLGGPTGYAINPARDLGPRLAHQLLPIPDKGSSDWSYALVVPLFGPITGGLLGALVWRLYTAPLG